MESKLCDLFGIKYPIMQGGMQWLATPEFAAAVSNAGALGTLNSSLSKSKEEFVEMIRRTRSLTKNPFAVNISMLPNQPAGELTLDFLSAVAEEKVDVVELSGTDPTPFVPALKNAGIKVIHKSPAVRSLKKRKQQASMPSLLLALSVAVILAWMTSRPWCSFHPWWMPYLFPSLLVAAFVIAAAMPR